MVDSLNVRGEHVEGEVALSIAPGTVAADRDRALDAALGPVLTDAAGKLGAVVASPPHRFARILPGLDTEGRTRFVIRGRSEGGCLVPAHNSQPTNQRNKNDRRKN